MGIVTRRTAVMGVLLDLSTLGLRFVADKKLTSGGRVGIEVSFSGTTETLECFGLVRWVHPHGKPGEFVVGVEFEPLEENQTRFLERLRQMTLSS